MTGYPSRMKDHIAQVFAAVGIVAVLLGGFGWMLAPLHEDIREIRADLQNLVGRVSHLEAQMEVVLERLPPTGGRISPAAVPAATPGGDDGVKREGGGAGSQAAAAPALPAVLLPDSSCPREPRA